MMRGFNFGANWQMFSERRLDPDRLAAAARSLQSLLNGVPLEGESFLDVGCGTGLFSIAAATLGARPVVGVDLDATCVSVSRANQRHLAPGSAADFRQVSALDAAGLERLGTFRVVYAWGSLHHTGAMWAAIDMVAKRVEKDGIFILAIYARHFTSPMWRVIRKTYNRVTRLVQRVMAVCFGGIIFAAKLALTGKNPCNEFVFQRSEAHG